MNDQNIAFISADYQLLVPSNGHDILEDVLAIGSYIRDGKLNGDLNLAASSIGMSYGSSYSNLMVVGIDSTRLAVAGASAGGYPAHLASLHWTPRPRAIYLLYGFGASLCSKRYWMPRPVDDDDQDQNPTVDSGDQRPPAQIEHLFNHDGTIKDGLPIVHDIELAYPPKVDNSQHSVDPVRLGFALYNYIIQRGILFDLIVAIPGAGAKLREELAGSTTDAPSRDEVYGVLARHFPTQKERLIDVLPELAIGLSINESRPTSTASRTNPQSPPDSVPSMYIIHGETDDAVPIEEAEAAADMYRNRGGSVVLVSVPGLGHGLNSLMDPGKWRCEFEIPAGTWIIAMLEQ